VTATRGNYNSAWSLIYVDSFFEVCICCLIVMRHDCDPSPGPSDSLGGLRSKVRTRRAEPEGPPPGFSEKRPALTSHWHPGRDSAARPGRLTVTVNTQGVLLVVRNPRALRKGSRRLGIYG
jgi:hypothetical protein